MYTNSTSNKNLPFVLLAVLNEVWLDDARSFVIYNCISWSNMLIQLDFSQ